MTINDITIFQAQQLYSAIEHYEGNEYEIGMEIFLMFDDIPKEVSSKFSVLEFQRKMKKHYEVLGIFEPKDEWVRSFECKGKTYKVEQFIHNWDASQWVSIKNLTKTPKETIENCHLILATLCQDERSLVERAEDFQTNLSFTTAFPISVFFCAVLMKLENDMPNYLKEAERVTGSRRNGIGMMFFIMWQGLLFKWRMFLKQRFSIS